MNTVKMTEFERMYEEHEQGRKTAEAQCQQLDEQLELNEVALIEARQVAEDSNHKYEESVRKGQFCLFYLFLTFSKSKSSPTNWAALSNVPRISSMARARRRRTSRSSRNK